MLNTIKKRLSTAHFSTPGIVVATLFYFLSFLPSLLPRPWLYQGLIAGASASVGYAIGCILAWTYRWCRFDEPSTKFKADTKRALLILSPTIALLGVLLGASWQREVSKLVSQEPISNLYMIPIILISIITILVLVGGARLIRRVHRKFEKQIRRFLPERVSVVLSVCILVVVGFWAVTGVLFQGLESVADSFYSGRNDTVPEGVSQPTRATRSGSNESLVAWETIGAQGQRFVARGPERDDIQAFHSDKAEKTKDPIRIYAGVRSRETAEERSQLVVDEIKRTGAFEREVLVVATTTGTGWLEPQSVDSIEYMFNGDTAIVTQQYSYLPSWISFLVDAENAREAGRSLFDAVYAEWSLLPENDRPKLLVYGLSLGSFGSQAAFGGVSDITSSVDGALYLGTPYNTELWSEITARRDKGSPQWKPVYENGTRVRFASNNEDIRRDQETWQGGRVLYLQHASDPVVWFDFSLALNKPDWLSEPRGDDVSKNTRWYPFVTFFQVAVDQFFGTSVPNGHGHNYPNTIVASWEAVARPTEWSDQKSTDLQDKINQYTNE